MGTTSLRQLLQSLCCSSCWNYAVFWKLQHQNQMLLTWEDGYTDIPTQGQSMGSILNNVAIEGLPEMSSSNYEASATLGADTVGAAVAYMASIQYPFGDGVVGGVASTGNYSWVSSGDLLSGEFNSKFIPECPDEWMFQFAAGIKTILLVPVIPHGVLQLGSLESVVEDGGMVALIKEMFVNFAENTETLALGREFLAPVISYPNNLSLAMFEEHAKRMQSDTLMNQALANDGGDDRAHHDVGPFLSFPRDCELHKALGPAVMSNVNDYSWDSSICVEDVYGPSSLLCNGDLIAGREAREANGWPVYRDDPEHLLEPVVGLALLNTNSSRKIEGATSSMTSLGIFSASLKERNQTERSCLPGESTIYHSDVTSVPIRRCRNPTVSSSPAATSYGSMMSELIEEEQKTAFSSPNLRKISKVSGASKRKAKSGDNTKPRPRDRQLIQDRLKELRELVPNGAKCSIDGLLDRTVAHMLFLKSVGDRADKLRHWIPREGRVGGKNVKSPKQKDGNLSGTSWAVELGTDQQVCPIIVEDLEYPGHMLIEMVCEENDRFLEIAEVVHGLDLTILKGVMEKRSDNTWAHFVIEAPRGLHRLDIFWPLMKLLQQQSSPISNKI